MKKLFSLIVAYGMSSWATTVEMVDLQDPSQQQTPLTQSRLSSTHDAAVSLAYIKSSNVEMGEGSIQGSDFRLIFEEYNPSTSQMDVSLYRFSPGPLITHDIYLTNPTRKSRLQRLSSFFDPESIPDDLYQFVVSRNILVRDEIENYKSRRTLNIVNSWLSRTFYTKKVRDLLESDADTTPSDPSSLLKKTILYTSNSNHASKVLYDGEGNMFFGHSATSYISRVLKEHLYITVGRPHSPLELMEKAQDASCTLDLQQEGNFISSNFSSSFRDHCPPKLTSNQMLGVAVVATAGAAAIAYSKSQNVLETVSGMADIAVQVLDPNA